MGNNQINFDEFKYNIPISDKKEGETSIYRSYQNTEKLLLSPKEGINNLQDAYKYFFENFFDKPMLGERKLNNGVRDNFFTWMNYSEVKNVSEKLGTNFIKKDLAPIQNEWNNMSIRFVGIYSKNCVNWGLIDFACTMQGITTIPIYDTLGEQSTIFIFNQTNMTTLFLSSNHYENILKFTKEGLGSLKNLIIIDKENFTEKLNDLNRDNINLLFFDDLLECGEKLPWAEVNQESIYTFSYTSGTTGEPKGAMISHKNLISLLSSNQSILNFVQDFQESYLSYLPLAHVLERAISNFLFFKGSKYGYFSGNILKLTEDLEILKPTIFVTVPRLFLKFYQKINDNFNKLEGLKKKLVDYALNIKLNNLKNKNRYYHMVYDKLIFNKIKNMLGGRVKYMLTGSAPISPDILDFLKVCFCVPIIEGYGQTEGLAAEFSTHIEDSSSGHVGGVFPNFEFKLVDIPEMNYFSTDKNKDGILTPRGEVWVRGNGVIPGYYKNDEKNKETFTEDNWLQSGDIAVIDPINNRLRIIDRKKNIFKLSQGEYIAPEKIENAMKNIPFLNEIFVYGDSLNSFIIAILNIDPYRVKIICEKINIEYNENNIKEIVEKKEFKDYIISELEIVHKKNKFNSLERIRKFYIETKLFQDIDLLTTSFKVKRNEAKIYFKEQIDKLYE